MGKEKTRGRGIEGKGERGRERECQQKLVTTHGSSSVLLGLLHPGLGGGVWVLVCSSASKFCAERGAGSTRSATDNQIFSVFIHFRNKRIIAYWLQVIQFFC